MNTRSHPDRYAVSRFEWRNASHCRTLGVASERYNCGFTPSTEIDMVKLTLSLALLFFAALSQAQSTNANPTQGGTSATQSAAAEKPPVNSFFKSDDWFFTWGYNKTLFGDSTIHVSQPSMGNDFSVNGVQGHDEYHFPTCCSPDNLSLGRYLDEAKTVALDLSLDHTKFTSTIGQVANVTGTNKGGVGPKVLSTQYFSYMLHNGLNQIMVNLSYRKPILGTLDETSSLSFVSKLGGGIAVVHPWSEIDGHEYQMEKKTLTNALGFNNGWWRIVGTSASVELGMRYVVYKPIFLEWSSKQILTSMSNVPVYQGSASQKLRSSEIIFSVGYAFNH